MGSTAPFNLAHYGCDIYVETGTGHANCLKQAVASNCFKRHYSVDIDEILVRDARRVFPQAIIEQGTSVEVLERWLSSGEIKDEERVLFFLDAHFPGADFRGATYDVKAPNAVPLEQELTLIKKYRPHGKDYIICDDARIYDMRQWHNGAIEWLQVPGGLSFVYELFSEDKVNIDLREEGYILIDNR
jgi:hypothetical protein